MKPVRRTLEQRDRRFLRVRRVSQATLVVAVASTGGLVAYASQLPKTLTTVPSTTTTPTTSPATTTTTPGQTTTSSPNTTTTTVPVTTTTTCYTSPSGNVTCY